MSAAVALAIVPDESPLPCSFDVEDLRDRAIELAERDLDGTATQAEVDAFLSLHCPLVKRQAVSTYHQLVNVLDDRENLAAGELDLLEYDTSDPAVAADRIGGALDSALYALFPPARALERRAAVGL